jgi:hypothetical protein
MKKFAEENAAAVAHYKTNDDVVLTAPPEALQKFLIAHAKDAGMLTDEATFRRAKPLTPPATTGPAKR